MIWAVAILGIVLVVLNAIATRWVVAASIFATPQKVAWLLLVWLLPFLGFLAAWYVLREDSVRWRRFNRDLPDEVVEAAPEFGKIQDAVLRDSTPD